MVQYIIVVHVSKQPQQPLSIFCGGCPTQYATRSSKFFTANSRAMSNNLMLMLSCVPLVSKSPCHGLGSIYAWLSGRAPLIGQDCSPVTFLCNERGTNAVHTSSVQLFFWSVSYVVHLLLAVFHSSGLHQYPLQGLFGILPEAFHMSLRMPCMEFWGPNSYCSNSVSLSKLDIKAETFNKGTLGLEQMAGKSMPRDTALQPCPISLLDMQVTFLI
jgi:hypothetical protein